MKLEQVKFQRTIWSDKDSNGNKDSKISMLKEASILWENVKGWNSTSNKGENINHYICVWASPLNKVELFKMKFQILLRITRKRLNTVL